MGSKYEAHSLEGGNLRGSSREVKQGKTAHNLSASSLRKKSDLSLVSKLRNDILRQFLTNLQVVLLGTKLAILFLAIPLAVVAQYHHFGGPWVFALSMLGLIPLAERLSFLTEQIAFCTGPTVGGLLNATCGNATELIIALFALYKGKIDIVKYSLLGSILTNLLLVLGSSLFCGGLANLSKEQKYDKKQADVNLTLLFMGLICLMLPLMIRYSVPDVSQSTRPILQLSRVSSIVMVLAYLAYLFFQLKTHRQGFESDEEEDESDATISEDEPVVGFLSSLAWLIAMTAVVAVLSEYVVGTIEVASESWGISVSFISIILLPIVGNATEHAGAIIFALRNKLDISLGVALGSSTQIAMFVVPLSVIVAWIMGKGLDLNFHLLETGSLCLSVVLTAFTLQEGTSHYLKGLVLLLAYIVIAACFFVMKLQINEASVINLHMKTLSGASLVT